MQKFLQSYSQKFTPEFCHKFQVDLTILQSRLDFLQNYLEEKFPSTEEDSSHDDNNDISFKCLSCLEQAENLLREEIDTSALPLGEKHLADLKVLTC